MRGARSRLISYESAIHCYEEVLLLEPGSWHVYQRLAELHYTTGKSANLKIAKAYLCFLLSFNGKALRPLLALLKTCELLEDLEGSKTDQRICEIVNKKLKAIYASSEVASSVKGIF